MICDNVHCRDESVIFNFTLFQKSKKIRKKCQLSLFLIETWLTKKTNTSKSKIVLILICFLYKELFIRSLWLGDKLLAVLLQILEQFMLGFLDVVHH